jgi:hypothetical protein
MYARPQLTEYSALEHQWERHRCVSVSQVSFLSHREGTLLISSFKNEETGCGLPVTESLLVIRALRLAGV